MKRMIIFLLCFFFSCSSAQPGFISRDCGGTEKHTDILGIDWYPDTDIAHGQVANVSIPEDIPIQYRTLRHFPADNRKYCYELNVQVRSRYLVRASFLYGNYDGSSIFPKFDLSIGATHWDTVVIWESNDMVTREIILLATSPVLSVCLSNATTGKPFITTLELRQFNDSLYHTIYEAQFFLSLSARINFGALNKSAIRYPDDPFDRIWESDLLKRANFLVDVAPGTERISTTKKVDVNNDARPPQSVMQTAVVGRKGSLRYRLNLEGFPGNGWAFSYFAEIENLPSNKTRRFNLYIPGMLEYSALILDVYENAHGKYRLYQPGFDNISLPYTFKFTLKKTGESNLGPILNALEIYKYVEINEGSSDADTIASFVSHYQHAEWAQEGGDPCLPVSWSWLQCNSDTQPRIISINLSQKNLTGNIPAELVNFSGLVELRMDGNSLTGPIPDLSRCINLAYIHLENNHLSGLLPSSLASLPNLTELYVQNNALSGLVPKHLLKKLRVFNYSGNPYLHKEKSRINTMIICTSVGAAFLILVATIIAYYLFAKKKKKFSCKEVISDDRTRVLPHQKRNSSFCEYVAESAVRFSLSEIAYATKNFKNKIGSGGFAEVYYGKIKDGREIAAKVLINPTKQGSLEFFNEVSLLSRTHHKNLVAFLGFCQEEGKDILVYEFMHNGTLKEHLQGPSSEKVFLSWSKRLEIAQDVAKGLEYLHTGCLPAIIHRDIKSSNILLDKNMRAKVSDLGLSKLVADDSYASSMVKGTLGYLDPQYYTSQQLTEKSDVYSFGVILLELITGQEPISKTKFGKRFCNIVPWAQFHSRNGNIQEIIDSSLGTTYRLSSVWKIAEKAFECVQQDVNQRPIISEVLACIHEVIQADRYGDGSPPLLMPKNSICSSMSVSSTLDLGGSIRVEYESSSADDFVQPAYR